MISKNNKSRAESITVRDFFNLFPTDESCFKHIFEVRYGQDHKCSKCGNKTKWHRLKNRRAFSSQCCGVHLYPCADTLFEDTRTPLQLWFYSIYLFTTSRHGVSGKELQRHLGVTYKCAWRIGHEIRKHMANADGDDFLDGLVEIDETYVGGKRSGKRGRGADGKTIIFGMLQRD